MNRTVLSVVASGLLLATVGSAWLGCSRSSGTAPVAPQVVAVKRGAITTTITGSGNLAFSKTQDLVFDISGKVSELNIKLGDNISQGQVLAKLDTTDLDATVSSADLAVKSAGIDLTSAQQAKASIRNQEMAVQSAELSLRTAQQAQSSVDSAQISLQTAQNSLTKMSYPYTYSTFSLDVPAALAEIHDAQLSLNVASQKLNAASPDYGTAMMKFRDAQDKLTAALQRLGKGVDLSTLIDTSTQTRGGNETSTTGWTTTCGARWE